MSQAAKRPVLTAYYTSHGPATCPPSRYSHSATLTGAHTAATKQLFLGHYVKAVIYSADYMRILTLTRRGRQLHTTGNLP